MSYEKPTWTCGETITADKLNHMEDGIAEGGSGGGVFVVHFTYDMQTNDITADKTPQEIDADASSGPVIGYMNYSDDSGGTTYELSSLHPMQFTSVYVTGSTGVIGSLEMGYDPETDEPTGAWTLVNYIFDVTNPASPS